jgi:hypothetical protein
MPDGDKFERKLRSKIWKQIYRLACTNENSYELVRLMRNAVEQDLKGGLEVPNLGEIADLLHQAQGNPLFAEIDAIDREYELARRLGDIAAAQLSYPGTRLAVEAAKDVYADVNSCQQTMPIERVRERLEKQLFARVVDNQFFSRVREGLQEKTGLSSQEQTAREARIITLVSSFKRAPRRIQSQPDMTLDRLNQPIPVIEP